ncbi:MAG: hypothetical protein K9H64_07040 [Bacteroidales bacterium]|nr:hypothetical protein [Bacteroidales bacterium]MCF8455585.1 hypothetical protein [Bacteroidales bacterium]
MEECLYLEISFVDKNVVYALFYPDKNVQSKSFKLFCEKYKPDRALRFSLKDYKEEEWMTNIPLYAVEYALS